MAKRHYYIYKGYYWSFPCIKDEVFFHPAQGLIVKSYTDEEFESLRNTPSEVWEKVEENCNAHEQ